MLTTPAIRILKNWRPDLQIGIVVEDAFRDVFEKNPDLAEILPPEPSAVRSFRPKLTVNLHGGTRSIALTLASLARWRAAFGHFSPQWTYNVHIPRAQEILGQERPVHTAEHMASAMFYLGAPQGEIPRASLYTTLPSFPRPYAVIHPFASAAEKCWPAERFLELAGTLDAEPVFIGGPGDDLSLFAKYACAQGSLKETKRLLAGASLFIGNDSGPAHMAAAFGVPVVALFGPSDEVIWAPWKTESVVLKKNPLSELSVAKVRAAVSKLGVIA